MTKIVKLVWFICVYIGIICEVFATQTLSVAVLTTSEHQSDVYRQAFADFEKKHSAFSVHPVFYSDKEFKRQLPNWLESGEHDLLYWQGGQRLQSLIAQDVIQPIDTLLPKAELQGAIQAAVFNSVSNKTGTYALPFSQYGWGFYYNKLLFADLNVSPPNTWEEFVALCQKIKSQGANPLVQAIEEGWPVLAWLDYLSLDAGGTELRQQLITGDAVNSKAAAKLVEQFSQLLGHEWFLAPQRIWSWQQALQAVVRKQAAMTLMGQFAEGSIDAALSPNIGFFPFPKAQPENHSEIAPLEVWIVPRSGQNKNQLSDLLRYLLANNVSIAMSLGTLPVVKKTLTQNFPIERINISAQSLAQSDILVQFFDRDAKSGIAQNAARSFAKSIYQDNGDSLTQGLINGAAISYEMNINADSESLPQLYFSSVTGFKETFFASNLMQDIYQQLGYKISVTRFKTLEAALSSYRFGGDGELMRVDAYKKLAPALIQVPESLANMSFYLVCKDLEMCSSSITKGSEVLVANELLVVKNWALENHLVIKQYDSVEVLLKAFSQTDKGLLVLSASDVIDNSAMLSDSTYRTIISVPIYHYVHNKHSELVPLLNNALKQYKTTQQYQELKKRYWLQHN